MKKPILITGLLWLFSVSSLKAQWYEVYIQPHFIGMFGGLYFVNDSTGFWAGTTCDTIAGQIYRNDIVLRTKNYGNSWDTVYYHFNNWVNQNDQLSVHSICFSTPQKGFMVGMPSGSLLSTVDSGNTWQISSPAGFHNGGACEKIIFTDSLNGYVCTSYSFHKTTDGGVTWAMDTTILGGWDLSFPSPNFGFGTNCRSADGFLTQQLYSTEVETFTRTQVEFWNDSTGIISGYNSLGLPNSHYILARTTDAGQSWTLSDYYDASFGYLQMMNDSIGYAVGNPLKTIDGGLTWYKQEIYSTYPGWQALHCPSPNVCYMAGWNPYRLGHIARTTNGGGPLMERVGLQSHLPEQGIKVYPNPATNSITIKELSPQSSIEIYNSMGQLEHTFDKITTQELNIEKLENGLHYFKIYSNKGVLQKTGKFVKMNNF